MEATLTAYPEIAARLVNLFETRFDPGLELTGADREDESSQLISDIRSRLDEVASLDQDRILRSYLTLIMATLRTSSSRSQPLAGPSPMWRSNQPAGYPRSSGATAPLRDLRLLAPVEGVHLRFGPVARGGLRWSDRREDFRTEVLCLVKAQMVKNSVIVPVGAKGGFVVKPAGGPAARLALPAAAVDRDAVMAEGIACYREFISALLDVTDNLVGGAVVVPRDVVRHDGDDTYLVVAADKGTATSPTSPTRSP